ncbi:MAG: anti-sigma F factor [Syntrophomonadaceae bacterium]|nr:anti-sigma F factor [Syntrophomonadaceae bacterium]
MKDYVKIQFMSRPENVAFARASTAAFASRLNVTLEEIEELRLVVSEAVSNCVVHAYPGDREQKIELCAEILEDERLELTVTDWGVGIADVAAALQSNYSNRPEHMGLGFTFMKTFMDQMEVTSTPGQGTQVRLVKCFGANPDGGDL